MFISMCAQPQNSILNSNLKNSLKIRPICQLTTAGGSNRRRCDGLSFEKLQLKEY